MAEEISDSNVEHGAGTWRKSNSHYEVTNS
jgi:hypothetical protein